jgi:hypothetical protein
MSSQQKRTSRRFVPSRWVERAVPILLGLLLFALVFTIVLVILSVVGVVPTG